MDRWPQTNTPVNKYFSRQGEQPADVATLDRDGPGTVVLVVRAIGGKSSVTKHFLDGVANHGTFKGMQVTTYNAPTDSDPSATIRVMKNINELSHSPKWGADNGQAYVRTGVWDLIIESVEAVEGAADTFLRAVSSELGKGTFMQYAPKENGGIIALPVVVIEIPGFDNEIVDRVKELLESQHKSQGLVTLIDTRSFDREHLHELFARILPEEELEALDVNGSFNKLVDKYHGSAEFAMKIVSTGKRNAGGDGKSTLSFDVLFAINEPQFTHLIAPQTGRTVND